VNLSIWLGKAGEQKHKFDFSRIKALVHRINKHVLSPSRVCRPWQKSSIQQMEFAFDTTQIFLVLPAIVFPIYVKSVSVVLLDLTGNTLPCESPCLYPLDEGRGIY
jgi:hypothetical protein